ncbi:MAG: PQQ-dependent sugar dehydrogenase, partial [Mycobacterium sp.]
MGGSAAIARTDRPGSRYIGRVGGLAFALGIGAAVLAGAGAASADTSDSDGGTTSVSSSSSASSSSSSSSQTKRSAESEAESDTDVTEAADAEAESEAAADAEAEDAEEEADEQAEQAEEAETDSLAAVSEDAPAKSRSATPEDDAAEAPATLSSNITAAVEEPSPFERFFENQSPTLDHDPAENTVVEGRIEGDLHAEDPDSTRLTYTATRPTHGTVVINPDGTFAYTPGASYAGQDRFDVTVSDARSGFHIHGFAGLLNLLSFGILGSSGHRTTETVFIGFERAVVVSGLNTPVDSRFLPDGRIVVAEKGGAIKIVEDGVLREQPLITLSVNTLGERGVSGLAVDPDFATNGHLYVAYTTSTLRNRLSRVTVVGNTAGSELVLLQSTESAAFNHQGGALGFGPDGKLYWGLGDNGSGPNSQNLTNLHGKIIRINPDGTTPSDNPDLGNGALPQIYAYGLRNPFRLTFTPAGGLLVADVGAASFEEVNLVTAGGDYGWPGAEGVCNTCSSINPIYTYPRGSGAAIT